MHPALSGLHAAVAALALAACARSAPEGGRVGRVSSPPLLVREPEARLVLEAPGRVDARVGAVQVEVRLRNDGARAAAVLADPWLAELAVRGPAGEVRCSAAGARIRSALVDLAPGASLPLRLDVSARCEIAAPGEYALEIAFPSADAETPRAATRIAVAPRTWVNPGPR